MTVIALTYDDTIEASGSRPDTLADLPWLRVEARRRLLVAQEPGRDAGPWLDSVARLLDRADALVGGATA